MDRKVVIVAAVLGAFGVGGLFLFTRASPERAGASVHKSEEHGLTTLESVVPAPPRAGLMVVRPERPRLPTEAAMSPARSPGHNQPKRGSVLERAEQGLAELEAQEPDKFLALFSMLEETRAYSPSVLDHAREATCAYLAQRTELLRRAWHSYLDSEGDEVAPPELARLTELEQEFRARMQSLGATVPALSDVPDMIANTSHPRPFFANVVARPSESPSESADRGDPP